MAKPILVMMLRLQISQEEFDMLRKAFGDDYHILVGKSNNGTDSFKILNGRTSKKVVDRVLRECKILNP